MKCRKAFTLLEMVVVLALVGILVALVTPSFSRTIASGRLRSAASGVRGTFAKARALAVAGARERSVTFDRETGAYGIDNDAVRRLPESIRFGTFGDASAREGGGHVRVRFFADGSAEEVEIRIAAEDGGALTVTVEPLTGIAEAGT
ncbi:MAG: prepilin-type N-terminal cleavage/methylation domain-containing protein [Deltaproteobacteria bacterium]|nr:MAG: prepilin-type N-terminal cleavage/methylation domain-containing protein [Deltaproteobacteria bacterium]